MAVLADIRRLNMRRALACGIPAIMATEAIVHDGCMIEICRRPGDRRVTVIAVISTGDVCRMLSNRYHTIVTRTAGAKNLSVIDRKHGREHIGGMAVLANVGCLNVCEILAHGIGTVVAVDAIASDIHVIEIRR